jgi:hypothetical protein
MAALRLHETPNLGVHETAAGQSDEQETQPLTGKARRLANLKPFVKGQSGNKSGGPKDLGRFGEILMKEFYKTVAASMNGKIGQEDAGRDRGAADGEERHHERPRRCDLPFDPGVQAAKPAVTATTAHPAPAAAINVVKDLVRATARLRMFEPKESRPRPSARAGW